MIFIDTYNMFAGDDGGFAEYLQNDKGDTVKVRAGDGVHFETAGGYLYYNAGVDPDARDLSPGVLMVSALIERALAAGVRRLDFLRGNEGYKYEWGSEDEPIQRLLVRRRNG